MKRIEKVDNLSTTITHHVVENSPNIIVVEQLDKVTGVIEYTLKIKHFEQYIKENPIRIYTNIK